VQQSGIGRTSHNRRARAPFTPYSRNYSPRPIENCRDCLKVRIFSRLLQSLLCSTLLPLSNPPESFSFKLVLYTSPIPPCFAQTVPVHLNPRDLRSWLPLRSAHAQTVNLHPRDLCSWLLLRSATHQHSIRASIRFCASQWRPKLTTATTSNSIARSPLGQVIRSRFTTSSSIPGLPRGSTQSWLLVLAIEFVHPCHPDLTRS
jgi:hypothetical protein